MLSLLKLDCSPEDIECALNEAMDRIDAMQRLPPTQVPAAAAEASVSVSPADLQERERKFVAEIVDSGFPRKLALRAAAEVGTEDVGDGKASNLSFFLDCLSYLSFESICMLISKLMSVLSYFLSLGSFYFLSVYLHHIPISSFYFL